MIWGRRPEPGDWISLTRTVPITLTDHLLGGGLRRGVRGVVNSRTGQRVSVDFDTGTGFVTATVDASCCRIVRREGGHQVFRKRAQLKTIARVALTLWLAWPLLAFVAVYAWTNGSLEGLTAAFVLACMDSLGEWFDLLIQQPVKTLLYLAFLTLLGRLAL